MNYFMIEQIKGRQDQLNSRLLKKLENNEFDAVLIETLNTWGNTSSADSDS